MAAVLEWEGAAALRLGRFSGVSETMEIKIGLRRNLSSKVKFIPED
jgi:hypothetical protein